MNAKNPSSPSRRGGARPGAGRPPGTPLAPGCVTLGEARRRKEQALAELREMESAEARGSLVRVAEVQRGIANIAAATRSALERLPDKLAEVLAAESDAARVHALLLAEVDSALGDSLAQLGGLYPETPT